MGRMRTPRDWRKGRGRTGGTEAKGHRADEGRRPSADSLQRENSPEMGRRWLVAFLDADEPQPITGLVGSGIPLRDPPRNFYMNSAMRLIGALLFSLIKTQAGLFLITGKRGLGKSLLVTWLAQKLRDAGHLVMVVDHPGLALDRLLQNLSVAMQLPPPAEDMAGWLRRLGEALARDERATAPVLMMDDADLAGDGALLSLLPLLDTPADCPSGIRMVLVGRPGFAKRFDLPAFAKLKQRLLLDGELEPFDERDIASLIRHQTTALEGAEPASDDVIAAIARHAGGLPGDAAFLWTQAMRLARDDGERTPSREHVERAARMLHPSLRHASQRPPIEQVPAAAAAKVAAASRRGREARRHEGKEGRRIAWAQRGAVWGSAHSREKAWQSPRARRPSLSRQHITRRTLSGLATAAALVALMSVGSVVDSVWYGAAPTSRAVTAENTLRGNDGEARTAMRTESDGSAGEPALPASSGEPLLAALPSDDMASQSGNATSLATHDDAPRDEAPRDERQLAQGMAAAETTAIGPSAGTEVAHENGDQVALASPPAEAPSSPPVERQFAQDVAATGTTAIRLPAGTEVTQEYGDQVALASPPAEAPSSPPVERQFAQDVAATGTAAIRPSAGTEVAHENGDQVALPSPPVEAQSSPPVDRSGMRGAGSVERKPEPGRVPEKRIQIAAKHKTDRIRVASHELRSPEPTSRQPLSPQAPSPASASAPKQNSPAANPVELASTLSPTPRDSTRAADGPQCQSYSSNVNIALRDMHVNGVACRGADGQWWLMNQHSG